MKKLAYILIFLLPLGAFAQQKSIDWMSIEEAQALQDKEPRKIMMDVYTKWCGPCKLMMANTFTNHDLIDYVNENFYAVKFDAESPDPITFKGTTYDNPDYDPNRRGRNGVHKFSRYMRVQAYPTIVYLDENLNLLTADAGYKTPQQIELFLRFFADEKYKEVKTQEQWQAYQSDFVPSFK